MKKQCECDCGREGEVKRKDAKYYAAEECMELEV